MTDRTLTERQVEAALCAWEWINDVTLLQGDNKRQDWIDLREGCGSMEMRWQCMDLGIWICEVYDLAIETHGPEFFEGQGMLAFDWHIVPEIMKYAMHDEAPAIYADHLPKPADVVSAMKRDFWMEAARNASNKLWCYDLTDDHSEKFEYAFENGDDPHETALWVGDKYELTPASML